tara:strand:+ start:448302 stop:449042 length:741 start_codon:yes stop_codon:yes gene_type:complete
MSLLEIKNATKRYGDTAALQEVSVVFPVDSITAVIGASGCGKSTLLKLCNGLVRPDAGEVCTFGQPLDYDNLPLLRRRLGYAVQGNGLFPHLTVRGNIVLLAELEGWSATRIESRLEELLQFMRLSQSQLTQYPHQLSGGQQQRVGLCRAFMLQPEALLLDEPFAAIDPITREDIHAQLLALHRAEPTTTLLVTHDMREAMRLADNIVIMSGGRIITRESTDTLRARNPDIDPHTLLHNLLAELAA